MAKPTTKKSEVVVAPDGSAEDFSADLISALNKEFGSRVAYNLSNDISPTHVKRWISTGSLLLDYAVANRRGGGFPEGRIIEISGMPSTGKSHIAFQVARTVQQMGGLVVYIDTENATPVEKLADMGIDVSKRFVYCDTHCTEEVFSILESTILKAKSVVKKNVPILAVWDSVAATSPKAELDGNYEDNTMGLQARVIAKALRKITGVIGQNNVTFLCLNQLKSKIGVMFGDPMTTPGGNAIPFHSSVRLRLTGGSAIKNKDGHVIGISVNVTVQKNKVAPPHRKVSFDIIFGTGISEGEATFDLLREACKKGPILRDKKNYLCEGTGQWKQFMVSDAGTGEVLLQKKFTKNQFTDVLNGSEYGPALLDMIETVMVVGTAGRLPEDFIEEEPDEVEK